MKSLFLLHFIKKHMWDFQRESWGSSREVNLAALRFLHHSNIPANHMLHLGQNQITL